MNEIQELKARAQKLRQTIFRMIVKAGGGHITPSFSIVEILTVLYFRILNIDKTRPLDENRDRFILSKGHGCAALYAALIEAGFADEAWLETFCQPGGKLGGHPDIQAIPGIEATTGALGHGFVFGMGMALAGKIDRKDYRVFTVLGDGECQEGSVWEAAMFAAQHKLDNLIAIIDYNKLQAMGPIKDILSLEPLVEKWTSFNWAVREVDGHNIGELLRIFRETPFENNKPNMIIAHTIKGKGISYMEHVPIWHYRLPNEEEMQTALRELGMEKQ